MELETLWVPIEAPRAYTGAAKVSISVDGLWLRVWGLSDKDAAKLDEDWEKEGDYYQCMAPASLRVDEDWSIAMNHGWVNFMFIEPYEGEPPFPPLNDEIVRRNVLEARNVAERAALEWRWAFNTFISDHRVVHGLDDKFAEILALHAAQVRQRTRGMRGPMECLSEALKTAIPVWGMAVASLPGLGMAAYAAERLRERKKNS